MRANAAARRYWDRRLDPIDWRRPASDAAAARWRVAHATFPAADTRAALAALGDLRGRRLLELGCGLGAGTAHLAARGARVTAIDLSPVRAARARDLQPIDGAPVDLCAADAGRLPFAADAFECVFARDVLMYREPACVVREVARVLAPGGRAVFVESLAVPGPLGWWRRRSTSAEYREFTRHLRLDDLRALGPPLRRHSLHTYHLTSTLAFALLFGAGADRLHRALLPILERLDRGLFRFAPALRSLAWRGVLVLDRPREDT